MEGFFIPMNYYLYILESEVRETFYIGMSVDPKKRLAYHNSEDQGYTKRYRPWKIVFTQEFDSKERALEAEKRVKKWKSNKMTRLLIAGEIAL